jgi:hypothetical protein
MLKLIITTVIIVVLAFVALAVLVPVGDRGARDGAAGRGTASEDTGSDAFSLANRQIAINSSMSGTAFGNSPQAQAIASAVSVRLKEIRATQFTGGGRDQAIFTKGEFLTHCTITPGAVVLLCHVPELRKYSDDAKAAMRRHAWTTTQEALAAAGVKEPARTVFVALRGVALYDLVVRGKTGENRHADLPTSEGMALIKAAMSATGPTPPAAEKASASAPATEPAAAPASVPSAANPAVGPEAPAPAAAVPAPAAPGQ